MLTKQEMLEILRQEVMPALGCTEPVCVSLAAADAAQAVGGQVQSIRLEVNPNIFKNGMSVGIPGFDKVGLEYAAAIGALLKNPQKKLQLLEDLTPNVSKQAKDLAEAKAVKVDIKKDEKSLYVKCAVSTDNGEAVTVIRDSHTNIVQRTVNGNEVFSSRTAAAGKNSSLTDKLVSMSVAELRELAESFEQSEIDFLWDGIQMNDAVADKSIADPSGVGIADTFNKAMGTAYMQNDLMTRIMQRVASSIESRLDGCPYTIMSSSSAGSKGLAVILPISETAKQVGADRLSTLRALAFAHILNSYINAHIGKLSAMCACSMAASTAASAAMTYLMGGNDIQIASAIRNMTGTITGMICDGGKVGCAMKLATASAAAFVSAMMAVNNSVLRDSDGVCADTAEGCIRNMGRIANPGMAETDKEILAVMLEKTK